MPVSDFGRVRAPYTAKGAETREHIVRSASQVLLTDGLSGFHLDKVRQVGGVSGSQLSHYFTDRQALIRAVLELQMEVVLEFHRQPAMGGLQSLTDYEQWAQSSVRLHRRIGYGGTPTYHSLNGQLAKSDDLTRQALAAGYRRWAELLEESFGRMIDSGVLTRTMSPHQMALVLMAGHQGGGVVGFAVRQEWPLADACRFVVNRLRMAAVEPGERVPRRPQWSRRRQLRPSTVVEREPVSFTRKGMATRDRIVKGTAELMFERGVHQTRLEDVRKALNVSGSQLAHYFGGKRELMREVIALRAEQVLELHNQPGLRSLDSMDAVRAWAQAYMDLADTEYRRGGCIYGSLVGELLEADVEILNDLAAGYRHWSGWLHDGLSSMRRRGDLQPQADPRHLATVLLVAHQGGAMLAYTLGYGEPFRVAVSAAVDYVASFTL